MTGGFAESGQPREQQKGKFEGHLHEMQNHAGHHKSAGTM